MNQNFSKSKFLHESSKLEHFQWGVKIWGYKFRGVKILDLSKVRFPTIIIFVIFWTGGKNSPDCLEKKYGNIGLYFCSSIVINLIIKIKNREKIT